MPLLCGLGRHKIAGLPRWNDGFYFTTCRRCGQDLVRTAFENWTVPDGFRVVWRSDAPQRSPSARLVDASIEHPQESNGTHVEFPIRDGDSDLAEGVAEASDFPELDDFAESDGDTGEAREAEPAFAFAGHAEEALRTGESARDDADFADADSPPIHDLLRTLWKHEAADPEPEAETAGEVVADEPEQDALPEEPENTDAEQPGPDEVAEEQERDTDAEKLESDEVAEESERDTDAEQLESDAVVEEPGPELFTEPLPEPAPPTPRYLVIPDFMDEKPLSLPYDKDTGQIRAGPAPAGGAAELDDPASVLSPGWRNLVRERAENAGVAGNRLLKQMRPERGPRAVRVERAPRSGGAAGFFAGPGGAIAAGAVFGGLVLLAAVVDGRNRPASSGYRPLTQSQAQSDVPAPASPVRSAARAGTRGVAGAQRSDLAFVTASLLNCRAIPADNGETVRRLARGDAVQVLGADPGWLSVSHQGRQCWASARWISTERPL